MTSAQLHRWIIVAVHVLLGVQYVLGGLNWWVKLFPFPNLFDTPTGPGKHAVLDAMIATGWMFTSAKIVELGGDVRTNTPDEFTAWMTKAIAEWGEVAKAENISLD